MATLLPTARMEIFTAAAHAPFASEPDRFAAAVHSFAASPS
jgi:pimeloyl-ACP methyl ester carboxylesterase